MANGGFRRSLGIPMGSPTVFRARPGATIIIILVNVLIYVSTSYGNFFIGASDYWVSLCGFIPSLVGNPSPMV